MKRNQKTHFAQVGMSKTLNAKAKKRAEHDYYATSPIAIDCLVHYPDLKLSDEIWECACGEGHLSERLADFGYSVYSTDLIDRGYGDFFTDFLSIEKKTECYYQVCDIVTNPPFKLFNKFMKKGLELISNGNHLVLLGKLSIQESQTRGKFFKENPPKFILVFSKRLQCARNGDFENFSDGMQAYAWYIWEKGYKGKTIIDWVNNDE